MARMKFLCDAERCIECNGCVTACKQENDVPWGVNRRRVVTINDGVPGERSVSVACMHCSDAPCMAVCPVDCFYRSPDGVVLHDKDLCIGCGYCFYACPFGAPQFPQTGAFGVRGKMDKCTFCAGGPEPNNSEAEFKKYGRNRLAEGKLPACAEMCSTKALLAGDADVLSDIYRERVVNRAARGTPSMPPWGWDTAYGRPEATEQPAGPAPSAPPPPATGRQIMIALAAFGLAGRALVVGARGLAGCGERPQVIEYKQGKYQGKPDQPPWDSAKFNGNRPNTSSRSSSATRTRTNTSGSVERPTHEGIDESRGRLGGGRSCSDAVSLAWAQSPAVNPTEAKDAAQQAARQQVAAAQQ